MIPLISADLFGLENLGANYKTATLGEAVGFLLVGKVRPPRTFESALQRAKNVLGWPERWQVDPCIPAVGIQLQKAEVGPTSGPTSRVSHYVMFI